MGIMDAFKPEDRTEITYSNFYNLIKQAAQYEIVMNAVNCDVPHAYIRETMTGKKENTERKTETVQIPTNIIEAAALGVKDIPQALTEAAEKERNKNHGENESEI